jgi:hypothetical protein
MPEPKRVGVIAREYLAKYPDVPILRLANMMAKDDPKTFSAHSARNLLSWHSGKRGGRSRKHKSKIVKSKLVPDNRVPFAYRAPKTHADPTQPFVIAGEQRILRLCDIHYPFHDEAALSAAIEYGMKGDPTILLLDGDVIDCHDLSVHDKDPRHRYTEIELQMIAAELEQFRQAFPKARIIWKEGNHEFRLQRYLTRRAPELFGLEGMDIPGLIKMANGPAAMDRVEWVTDKRVIRAGNIAFLHGHEFMGGGGVNPARWLFLRTGENATCGHFHRTSEHSEPGLSKAPRGAWSSGCLCDLSPAYNPHNKWNHGFQWIDVERSGNFRLKNIRVVDGKVY